MDGYRDRHQLGGEQHHRAGGADHAIRDDERVPSRPSARNPGSILFHGHHENKHHIRRLRHHMRPAVGHARLRGKTMASRIVRTRGGHLVHRHAHHGQTGRR